MNKDGELGMVIGGSVTAKKMKNFMDQQGTTTEVEQLPDDGGQIWYDPTGKER